MDSLERMGVQNERKPVDKPNLSYTTSSIPIVKPSVSITGIFLVHFQNE